MLFNLWARVSLSSRRVGVGLAIPAMILWLFGTTQAQVLYGSLTGIVLDPSGGVVPNATVTTENVGTGATKEIGTDERGAFLLNNLQPGMYRVTIIAKGFGTLTQ